MRIEIRSDSVMIDGYVNAVARDSRPIVTSHGKVVEQIEPRAFERALERAENVDLLLNHNENIKFGSTTDGNIELFEDNIGLRAICTLTDPEAIAKARNREFRGWSFGMYVNKDEIEERANGIPRRVIRDLDIFEVSLIDRKMNPVYVGTSIETRADQEVIKEERSIESRAVIIDMVETPKKTIDYSTYENRLNKL